MLNRRHSFRSTDPTNSGILRSDTTRTPAPPPAFGSGVLGGGSVFRSESAVPHDLACGLLVGIFEAPLVTVTLDAITVTDAATRIPASIERGWLDTTDQAGRLARDCFEAKQKMSGVQVRGTTNPWGRAGAVKSREELAATFRDTRRRLCELLKSRGVTAEAQRRGMRVLIDG